MEVIKGLENVNIDKDCAVCIGNFDGLHLGHRSIISRLKKESESRGLKSVILTFDPHPYKFFNKDIKLISTPKQREEKFAAQNTDYLICAEFNKSLSDMAPEEFFKTILLDKLHAKLIIVGNDYRFGKGKQGDTALLAEYGRIYNVDILLSHKMTDSNGEIISSSRIRTLLSQGLVDEAAVLLNCPYALEGVIIHGDERGRKIGFPTINLKVDNEMLPLSGVYAAKVKVKGQTYNSMAYIGHIPTINNKMELRVEANIFDFHEEIYGEFAEIVLYKYIRSDIKFNSLEGLMDQMKEDEAKITVYLKHFDEYSISQGNK